MNKQLQSKLKKLPLSPGVYFYKDETAAIIYIGKAANLRNRVRQYFQKSRTRDLKTDILVAEIVDMEWTELETEADALFLEAELVKRYQPRFNILLRDDKSQQFVRIDYKSDYPTVSLVRQPLDDGARYFGPYINGLAVKKALRYLRRAFPYATARPVGQKRASLHYHLGLDPGLEEGRTTISDYRANLRKLMQYLQGKRVTLVQQIERDMKKAATAKDFETATILRNQLFALKELNRQILFGDHELQDATKDQALADLAKLLALAKPPRRIEGFDISHIQGTDTVASMVVFVNGVPDKAAYRKFKMRLPGNDDFGHIYEALSRRLSETNRHKWGTADLILIDGGKGQLQAALRARDELGLKVPMIGLAKRREEIIIKKLVAQSPAGAIVDDPALIADRARKLGGYVNDSGDYLSFILPMESHIIKLLQRIRDESHRFAVSYHSSLRQRRQSASLLDEIPGVGPAIRKKLIRHFGSTRAVIAAEPAELQKLLGKQTGQRIAKYVIALK